MAAIDMVCRPAADNPDDADCIATMTFCLMHEYPEKEGGDPTAGDCYAWGE